MLLNIIKQTTATGKKGITLCAQRSSLIHQTFLSTVFSRKINTTVNYTKSTKIPHTLNPSLTNLSIKFENLQILDNPHPIFNKEIAENMKINQVTYIDQINENSLIQEPTKIIEKQAARLIVIRRKKMKRHKLKKLRKKMKFEWAKVRQRRELRKEKAFQAELMGKIEEANKFDPAAYATNKINKANEILIPKLWRGKRLPEFVIKDLIAERERKRAKKLAKVERRKRISFNVSDYNV